MTRKTFILASDLIRGNAIAALKSAPAMARVEIKAPKRTLPQNDHMWALLTAVSEQVQHCGRSYPPETWKAVFLNALGQEMQFVPTLDGKNMFPLGMKSSELSVSEMADLITFILSWGDQNSVTFYSGRDVKDERGRMVA